MVSRNSSSYGSGCGMDNDTKLVEEVVTFEENSADGLSRNDVEKYLTRQEICRRNQHIKGFKKCDL